AAFPSFSATTVEERVALLENILRIFDRREEEFVLAVQQELGTPRGFAKAGQVIRGPAHIKQMLHILKTFEFEERRGSTCERLEPVGVCGLISPWNWPVNQVVVKLIPALAAGCTMVLKPSEYSPISSRLLMEVIHEA